MDSATNKNITGFRRPSTYVQHFNFSELIVFRNIKKIAFQVLRKWYNQTSPTVQALLDLLEKGENIGAVEKGTADHLHSDESKYPHSIVRA